MRDISSLLAFLAPIGVPELIMILIVLVIVVGVPVGIVVLVLALNKSGKAQGPQMAVIPPPLPPTGGSQARLQELEALRTQGLISADEYEMKRKQIPG